MDSSSYISLSIANPLFYLLGGSLCYIASGLAVLVIGVIITSIAFQNLDVDLHESKQSYAGPVLIGAGLLIMGRGALVRIKESDCHATLKRHWEALCIRLTFVTTMMEPSIERIHVDLLTWRQDTHLHRMLHSIQCSVALGTGVLVIGVIITVVSLKDYEDDSKIFLVGPVLMTVGILGMTRAIIHHFKQRELRRSGRRRRRRQREGMSNICQRHESEATICLTPPLGDDLPYPDEPPPYDAVSAIGASVHLTMPALPPYEEGLSNPALDLHYAPPPAYDEIMGASSVYATQPAAAAEASGVPPAAPPPQQPPKTEHAAEAQAQACGSQTASPQCASKGNHETPSSHKPCDTFACETEEKSNMPCEHHDDS